MWERSASHALPSGYIHLVRTGASALESLGVAALTNECRHPSQALPIAFAFLSPPSGNIRPWLSISRSSFQSETLDSSDVLFAMREHLLEGMRDLSIVTMRLYTKLTGNGLI